jgi:hypothetical protein
MPVTMPPKDHSAFAALIQKGRCLSHLAWPGLRGPGHCGRLAVLPRIHAPVNSKLSYQPSLLRHNQPLHPHFQLPVCRAASVDLEYRNAACSALVSVENHLPIVCLAAGLRPSRTLPSPDAPTKRYNSCKHQDQSGSKGGQIFHGRQLLKYFIALAFFEVKSLVSM